MKFTESLKVYSNKLKTFIAKSFYHFKELTRKYIIPFLLCYLIGLILVYFASISVNPIISSLMINLAASLFLIPLIFLIYTTYNDFLMRDSTTLISKILDEKVAEIFLRYLFFSSHFYSSYQDFSNYDPDFESSLSKDENMIKTEILNVTYGGYFIFSDFDRYDGEVEKILDSIAIHKYIGVREIAILHDFISNYREFLECFRLINIDAIIPEGSILNLQILESKNSVDDANEPVYDISDETNKTFYTTKYRFFDHNILASTYHLSEEKAGEIAGAIHKTYKNIIKWYALRGVDPIKYVNYFVIAGRLFPNSAFLINTHFDKNVSIKGRS